MKKLLYIALLFSACNADRDHHESDYPCALYAVFESGTTPQADLVCAVGGAAEGNRLEWWWGDGTNELFSISGNRWSVESGRLPEAGESCLVRWQDAHGVTEIPIHFPPQPKVEEWSADTLYSNQDDVIEVQWTELGDDYEYVLFLECLEPNPIPIGEQSGNFELVHAGPQLENTLSLEVQNFTFRGAHRLVIYTLNRAFTDVYFEDPSDIRGLLKMPMSNLPGANGYVMCVSAAELQIVVE